jgi:aerobic carbon-monoxide dehydrogenase medium subunit
MHRFELLRPESVTQATALLGRYGEQARLIAGGTDLLIALKEGLERPAVVVSLGAISDLSYIAYDDAQGLRIGAATTVREVEQSPVVRAKYPVLAGAARVLASIQIRNLATVAGNICRASPSADTPPALLVMDARVVAVGPSGERVIPLDRFFTGPGQTVLRPDELLVEIQAPPPLPNSAAVYVKHSPRRAMDLAVVGVAVLLALEDGRCSDARIALGAVAPTPRRVRAAEETLRGRQLTAERLEDAARAAAEESSPISDVRGSAKYRRRMVHVLTRRALDEALDQARAQAAGGAP